MSNCRKLVSICATFACAFALVLALPVSAWADTALITAGETDLEGGESDSGEASTETQEVKPLKKVPTPKADIQTPSKQTEVNNQWIKNGTYVIESFYSGEGMILSAKSAASKKTAVVKEKKFSKLQKWIFKFDYSTKTYTIQNAKSKKALTYNKSKKKATLARLGRTTLKTQRWILKTNVNGYVLRPYTKTKAALVYEGKKDVSVKKAGKKASVGQFFNIYNANTFKADGAVQDGVYNLYNIDTKKMLQLQENFLVVGTKLNVGDDTGELVQKFQVTRAGKYYKIVNIATDMAVAADTDGNIELAKKSAAKTQKWQLTLQTSGGYTLYNVGTQAVMGTDDEELAKGEEGKIKKNIDASQHWMLLPTTSGLTSYQLLSLSKANHPRPGNYSSTGYFLTIDKTVHHMIIWKRANKKKGVWTLLKDWRCTTSMHNGPYDKDYYWHTAKAKYPRQDHVHDDGYCYGAKYWSSLGNGTHIHSILFVYQSERVKDGRLGYSLSGGCNRLAVANAKWVYDYLPYYTGYAVYYK